MFVKPRVVFDTGVLVSATLKSHSTIVEAFALEMQSIAVIPRLNICRDPDDNKILDLAVQGHAQCIVTGDADLLVLHPFNNIQIVTPAQFMVAS